MASSVPNTPKTNFVTPKRFGVRTPASGAQETPECFNRVTVETPVSTPKLKTRRSSKEKFDEVNNLTVAVRIRPMNSRELACVGAANVVKINKKDLIIRSGVAGSGSVNIDHIFQYDHIFWSVDEESPLYAGQQDVFVTLGKPLLDSAFKGYNACLFAYGQTGSGKSYSMMGPYVQDVVDIDSDNSGVIPRFCRELFLRISELDQDTTVSIDVNYFEIYNEKIHDLLAVNTSNNRAPLKVREHPEWGPYVVDLSVHSVNTYDELRNCLLLGNKNRATAATSMNEKSSRSHSIFSIELCLSGGAEDAESSRRSKVSLVDLAGSERIRHSLNSEEKIRQGVSINKSLLTLGKVISALAEQKRNQFVPYRDSVLTWLLRESLGGNSLTSMLATVSPANSHVDETLSTLRYACQARAIINRARINESPHSRLIRELTAEVERLRALRKDYERNSLSSIIHVDDSINDSQEMEKLREKLLETEKQLSEAQLKWEQRFMETKQLQLKELAAAEKRKEELESHVRVFQTLDMNINLSPVRTNFLETVDGMLRQSESNENINWNCNLEQIRNMFSEFGLDVQITLNDDATVTVLNKNTYKQAVCSVNKLESLTFYPDIHNFFEKLQWVSPKKNRKLSKSEVVSSINQIYQALAVLRPTLDDEEDKLRLLFAKVNKSVQSLETALLNSVNKSNQKNVTFNV